MLREKQNIKTLLANLNLIIIIIGYPLVAVFLIPFFGNSAETTRIVTVPFRFIALSISLATLFFHLKDKIKINVAVKVFLLFWVLVLLRIFYDLEIRTDYNILSVFKTQIWIMALGVVLIPMISVIKSFNNINFHYCLRYIQFIGFVTLVIGFVSFSKETTSADRMMGTALDPISFAQLGGLVSLLSLFLLKRPTSKRKNSILKLFYGLSMLLGIFISLQTGSRGPMLAIVITILCYYIFKSKHMLSTTFKVGIPLVVVIFVFNGLFINMIGYVSPIFEKRLTETIDGSDWSANERTESYQWFWSKIQDNILTGSQFARLSNTDYPQYAHNIFLDILLGFGIIGLILFLYVLFRVIYYTRMLVVLDSEKFWIGLVSIQYLILSFFSGAYYSNPILNVSIVLTLLAGNSFYKKNISSNKLKSL